jgi:hypothetical protein
MLSVSIMMLSFIYVLVCSYSSLFTYLTIAAIAGK